MALFVHWTHYILNFSELIFGTLKLYLVKMKFGSDLQDHCGVPY